MITKLSQDDKDWVVKLFSLNAKVLGNMSGGTWFWRIMQSTAKNEFLIGVKPYCFAHYRTRLKDGVNVLYEIAVHPEYQRKGLAELLINSIGKPMELKTDAEHIPSNRLYIKLGFELTNVGEAKSGKVINSYEWK